MATTLGNKVNHALVSASVFSSLEKSSDTIYFVGDLTGLSLYKGGVRVGGGFEVLSSEPANTTGMAAGVLYLAPSGKMYYNDGGTLATALELATSSEENAAGNSTKVATVAALYAAINAKIAAAMSGTYRSSILAPVADVAALKAIASMTDKDVVFVESVNALFSYDAQSSATADDSDVVAPTSGNGRWLKTQAGFAYSSTDFTWGSSGLELNYDITTLLAGKSDTGHGHAIADVTGLQDALDAKAALSDVKWNVITADE